MLLEFPRYRAKQHGSPQVLRMPNPSAFGSFKVWDNTSFSVAVGIHFHVCFQPGWKYRHSKDFPSH